MTVATYLTDTQTIEVKRYTADNETVIKNIQFTFANSIRKFTHAAVFIQSDRVIEADRSATCRFRMNFSNGCGSIMIETRAQDVMILYQKIEDALLVKDSLCEITGNTTTLLFPREKFLSLVPEKHLPIDQLRESVNGLVVRILF